MASTTALIQRRRRRKDRLQANRQRARLWLLLFGGGAVLLIGLPIAVLFGGAVLLYLAATTSLPTPQQTIALDPAAGVTQLVDRSEQTVLFAVQDPLGAARTWVPLDSLPSHIAQATLLMEDPKFLDQAGFDALGTFAGLWGNFLAGPLPADGSLTGRLVRNVLAPDHEPPTADDRTRQIALIAEISRRYSPRQILEWHLNTNYYGNNAYGIDAAALLYLGKPARDLTLDEAALLAAIPLASQFNPVDDETAARGRQSEVLRRLLVGGGITQAQYTEAANRVTPLRIERGQTAQIAPDFVIYARRQAEAILNGMGRDGARLVARGGLKITTTLDLDLYLQSDCALRAHLARLKGQVPDGRTLAGGVCSSAVFLPTATPTAVPPDEGALLIIDVNTGEIKSLVGSVTKDDKQPGVTLQPFVYFEGFRSGLTPASMVLDIPRPFPGAAEGLIYTPANPNGKFEGVMNLRDALGVWRLPPVISVAQNRGLTNVLTTAHQIGVNGLKDGIYDLSLLEHGGAVSVLDMTYTYAVFAGLGEMRGVRTKPIAPNYRERNPVAVLKIEDASGTILWQYDLKQTGKNCTTLNCTNIFPPELGYLINDILADSKTRWGTLGEGSALDLVRPAAVVSGVTSDRLDNWTIGYTPQYAIGVHLDRADKQALALDAYGVQGAGGVWHGLMEYVHTRDTLPIAQWERPDKIIEGVVCERSGLLPTDKCPTRREIFIQGFQPYQVDTYWQVVEINSDTKQLATTNTPTGLRVQQAFFVPPPDALDWWRANNLPFPPTEYDSISAPNLLSQTQILQPQPLAYVGGVVDVRGSLDAANLQNYQLAYGPGLNPADWINITDPQTQFTPGVSLGAWDTSGLDGLYVLRLAVTVKGGGVEYAFAQVTIDNQAPTIALRAGEPGQVFKFPADTVMPLVADVQDNLGIERVEFYHNGQFVGTDTDFPFGFDWAIKRNGTEVFSASVFDKVGNSASVDLTVEVPR